MTTVSQDRAFGDRFFEDIVNWIANNLRPEDIFEEDALVKWARNYLGDTDVTPDQVFSEYRLELWAKENGWVKG